MSEEKSKTVKIVKCKCTHEGQDKLYGKGMRLANRGASADKPVYTCTVCGVKH
jgi:hypothetical protein